MRSRLNYRIKLKPVHGFRVIIAMGCRLGVALVGSIMLAFTTLDSAPYASTAHTSAPPTPALYTPAQYTPALHITTPHAFNPHPFTVLVPTPRGSAPHASSPHAFAPHTSTPYAIAQYASTPHGSAPHAFAPHTSTPHAIVQYASTPYPPGSHAIVAHASNPHASASHAIDLHTTARQVTVSGALSSAGVLPNEEFTLTLRSEAPADLYFFGADVEFDPGRVEFVSVRNTGLTAGGIHVYGMSGNSRIGFAVSRTGADARVQSGPFAELTFRARPTAKSGPGQFVFSDSQMSDSVGEPVGIEGPDALEVVVQEGIGVAELTVPAVSQVAEGEEYIVSGRVYASGVTGDEENSERVTVWAGVKPVNSAAPGSGAGAGVAGHGYRAAGVRSSDSSANLRLDSSIQDIGGRGGGSLELGGRESSVNAVVEFTDSDGEISDPATWDESIWKELELTAVEDDFYHYSGEIALFRDAGTYAVALRSKLNGGEFFYGGLNGFWDPVESPTAVLVIEPLPAFRYTLAGWDFAEEPLLPAYSVPGNDLAEIRVEGASFSGGNPPDTQTSGGMTYLNTRGWHMEAPVEEKYIYTVVNTRQFENLRLNSSHTGTPSGPRLFTVQLSPDGESWGELPGGEIDLGQENPFHLTNLEIPAGYADSDSVYVRWLKTGGERVSGDESPISSAGVHRIGGIRITGTNIDPRMIEVLPGDANDDGIVDSRDLLALAHYWQSRGPEPVYSFIDFEPRQVEAWIPGEATHADANGDGVVNQLDLLPVGLNFGKTIPGLETLTRQEPVARVELPALDPGAEHLLRVDSSAPEELKGMAYRITLEGVEGDYWTAEAGRLAGWAGKWSEEGRLLEFRKSRGQAFEEAFSLKGRRDQVETLELAEMRIVARKAWPGPATLTLEWVAVSRPGGAVDKLTGLKVYSPGGGSGGEPVTPDEPATELYPNYPNPFHPRTAIRYQIDREERVRLEVYDMTGRKVAVLVDAWQPAGPHTVDFDASRLAGGVYLYRLRAGKTLLTRSMVLVR